MKNWPKDPTFKCSNASQFKSIKESLDVETSLIEENEKIIVDFNLFKEDWSNIGHNKWFNAKNEGKAYPCFIYVLW